MKITIEQALSRELPTGMESQPVEETLMVSWWLKIGADPVVRDARATPQLPLCSHFDLSDAYGHLLVWMARSETAQRSAC